MFLNPEIINEIAAELGIDPAFVEKDWYSVQVLRAIAELQSDTISTIFSGGTSLSKGYGVLQRFSEDLDFRCRYLVKGSGSQQKKVRSAYRESVLSTIHTLDHMGLDEQSVDVASNFIKFPLSYSRQSQVHSALRPHLEIEFSFTQPRLPPELKPIQSLISQFTSSEPETAILCLSPIETGADKLSALTWRVLKRDRNSPNDDPAMIRHLHDLCALNNIINSNHDLFIAAAAASFEEDQKTGKRDTDKSFNHSLQLALIALRRDDEYRSEYGQFVDAMSYADDKDNISFDAAISSFEALMTLFE